MNPQDISNTVAPALQAIPLKPLLPTVIIVEKAWTSYKLFFKRLWPLSLATIGVGAIGVILLYAGFFYTIFSGQQGNFPASAVGPLYLVTLGCVFLVIVLFLAIFLRGVTDLYKSDFQGIGVAYSRGIRIFWPFLVLTVATTLIFYAGEYLLIIPAIAFLIYLLFSQFEFMVDGKRGFDALIGSWSLVKDRWWSIFGKILLIGLLCGLVAMIAEIVSVIFFVIAFGLATILHLEVLLIIFGVLFGIALIGALVVLVYPLLMLVYFELYFNAKESRIVSNAADTSKHKSRKTILVVFMIIGALIFMVMPFLWKIQSQILGTSSIDKFSFYKQINEQNSMNVQTNSADTTAANSFSNPGFPVINSIYPAIAEVGNTITITGYNFVPLGMSSTTDLTKSG